MMKPDQQTLQALVLKQDVSLLVGAKFTIVLTAIIDRK
jgi:hypothetical protein